MKESVLNISRGLHQSVQFLERLIAQASASLTELREIKEQLRLQNEQGRDSQLLTLEEMAEKLKVSVKTMFTWSRTGVLPPIKIGYGNYYRLSDLIKKSIDATQDEEQLPNLSRSLFRIVELSERLLSLALALVSELREIKALLRVQNGQAGDTKLLTAEEAAEKLKVSFWMLVKLEQTGALKPIHLQGKRYYEQHTISGQIGKILAKS